MSRCKSVISGSKCDTCEFKFACRYAEFTDSSDKVDDPCEGCDGNNSNYYIKKEYKIGPNWWTKC